MSADAEIILFMMWIAIVDRVISMLMVKSLCLFFFIYASLEVLYLAIFYYNAFGVKIQMVLGKLWVNCLAPTLLFTPQLFRKVFMCIVHGNPGSCNHAECCL